MQLRTLTSLKFVFLKNMKYKHPNDKRIIFCAVTAFICLAALVAVILRIFAGNAPRVLFIPLLLAGVGFLLSGGFIIRFCIERAKDKKNGVAIDRPINKRPLTKSEIACITLLCVSAAIFLLSVVFICYRGIIPDGVTAALLLIGLAGYVAGSIWTRHLFAKQLGEWLERKQQQKQQQKEELSEIPADDSRKEVAEGDEKDVDENPKNE